MTPPALSYDAALAEGHALYPGTRIGKPGRAKTYWTTIAAMRFLRLRLAVDVTGSEHVAPGAAILVGNHVSAMDPVVAVMSHWWRVTAFAKVEVFENRGAIFFRLMGQIPLRRGDEASTKWALDMARRTLDEGGKVGLYPEGTRSPDKCTMHRLHRRVLIPVLLTSPDVPVHAITTVYEGKRRGRQRVTVRISPRLDVDARTMDAEVLTQTVTQALVELGDLPYEHAFARNVKAARDLDGTRA
jgi:1-acyl-sn-glycerol-3-phosphate acyltransferase